MKRMIAMLVTAGLFAGCLLNAQENGRRNRGGQRRRERPSMQMTEETAGKWSKVQTQLKEKFPEKYAEIEKLAQTNIPQAMQKMVQLAREAGIATPMQQRGNRGGRGGEEFGRRGGHGGEEFGGRGGRTSFGNRGGMMMGGNQRAEAENQIKAKFPQEYEAIEKARSQAEEQLQALAEKAGVKLPPTQEAMFRKMAEIREKYNAEFEEIRKLRSADPQAAREKTMEIFRREGIEMPMMNFRRPGGETGMNPPPPARRKNSGQDMRKKIEQIRKAYPEEMKKIQELRAEDPQKFREEMRKLAERYDREHGAK